MIYFFSQTKKLVLIVTLLGIFSISHAHATATASPKEVDTTDEPAQLAAIGPYKKAHFAPARNETFLIPIEIKTPGDVKELLVEIRTVDDDLIKTLNLSGIKEGKTSYELTWDGRDLQKQLVPDEAYIPVLIVTDTDNKIVRMDPRNHSGGEEVYDFEKSIRTGIIEYTLPASSRMLIRSGIVNGPMLRTIIDWQPRTAGFHAERWSGRDLDNVIDIEQNPQVGYLIIGYALSDQSIITYGNKKVTYREYREHQNWPLPQGEYKDQPLVREGKLIRPEYYTPLLKQKSPRITVNMLDKTAGQTTTEIQGMSEIFTEVQLHPLDEIYLDQDRYEISFFVDNEFIAEE